MIIVNKKCLELASMSALTSQLITNLSTSANSEGIFSFVVGVAVVDRDKILIVKRSKTDDFLGGFCEIPGGGVDGGETILQSVERELLEETNLKIQNIAQYYGYFDYEGSSGKMKRQFNFIVSVKNPKSVKLNPEEHSEYFWENIEDFDSWKDKYEFTFEMKNCIREACQNLS